MNRAEAMAAGPPFDADAGDFRALVEEHAKTVFRLAYRMTGNEQDAEDVVQDTFLRAYRGLGTFESRAHVTSWLHRIAANRAIDLLRRRKRWRSADLDQVERNAPLRDGSAAPDRVALDGEVGRYVAGALEGLTARERSAFTLRHFEGRSIREISEITGSNINATKNHIFRAVQKMRRALRPLVDR